MITALVLVGLAAWFAVCGPLIRHWVPILVERHYARREMRDL